MRVPMFILSIQTKALNWVQPHKTKALGEKKLLLKGQARADHLDYTSSHSSLASF